MLCPCPHQLPARASWCPAMTQSPSAPCAQTRQPVQGGTVLSWIDICAGLAAKTFARGPCVTASVDAVHFLRPCHVRALRCR